MRKRKTAKIAVAYTPEPNRFDKAKVVTFKPKKNWAKQSEQAAIDFEQYLWDNAGAEFYEKLRKRMNHRTFNGLED